MFVKLLKNNVSVVCWLPKRSWTPMVASIASLFDLIWSEVIGIESHHHHHLKNDKALLQINGFLITSWLKWLMMFDFIETKTKYICFD